jgi:hypothetical protein
VPTAESTSSQKIKSWIAKLSKNKMISVATFSAQACMSVSDINYLVQEGAIAFKSFPVAGIRLQEASLCLLDSLVVRLADKAVSAEAVSALGVRVLKRREDNCISAFDWERSQELLLRPTKVTAEEKMEPSISPA